MNQNVTLEELITVNVICGWYARCDNPAIGTVKHPILGSVPVCERCRDKHDMTLEEVSA